MNEVRDILRIDVPRLMPALTAAVKRDGRDIEQYIGEGMTLKVTPHEARIWAVEPSDEAVEALEESGRSFVVIR
jgi:hypothetical protein